MSQTHVSETHGPRRLQRAQLELPAGSAWRRLPMIGLVLAVIGIGASLALGAGTPQFYFSWLVAFTFFVSIGLGGLFFVLVHHATKAGWGIVVRRLAEHMMGVLPLMVVLFVPVYLGMHDLYHWSHLDAVAHDPVLASKQAYLNPGFFLARTLFLFACWSLLAYFFGSASRRQDTTGDPQLSARMIRWSGPALFVFALTLTFAAFDWIMSLDPHWYSTIFGVYFFGGSVVAALAFLSVLTVLLRSSGVLTEVVSTEHLHDLGKLLFAFTVFWSYIAFSQFMLIWYANLPEETLWYHHRLEGSWRTATACLAWGHFAIPFLFLLPRTIKRKQPLLLMGALWMLAIHYFDLYWLIMPVLHAEGLRFHLLDLTTFLGVGGVFLAAVGWRMARDPLVPVRDPRLLESIAFENF